jgi:hypothetical protein
LAKRCPVCLSDAQATLLDINSLGEKLMRDRAATETGAARWWSSGAVIACVLVLTVACGGASTATVTATSAPTEQQPTAAAPETTAPAAEPTAAATPKDEVITFTMPNLVGKDLQTAQDTVQTHGVFYSVSHDLLGSRMQVLDSNWIVCDETPRAGTTVRGTDKDLEGKIDFGVVKRSESCP